MTTPCTLCKEWDGASMLYLILDHCSAFPSLGVPTLCGPPQMGKTFETLAYTRARARPLVMINPQCELPEDIGGHPRPAADGQELRYTLPSFLTKELAEKDDLVIVIDEADKARDDSLSTLLQLLDWQKRIRNVHFKLGVLRVVLMNFPKRQLPEPLIDRLLFLPWPMPGANFFTHKELRPLVRILGDILKTPEVAFPARPKDSSLGSAFKLAAWMEHPQFWAEDGRLRQMLVRGLYNANDAAAVLQRLEEEVPMDAVAWATQSNPAQIAATIIDVLYKTSDVQTRLAAWEVLRKRAAEEPAAELRRVLDSLQDCVEAIEAMMQGASEEVYARGKAAWAEHWARELKSKPSKEKGKGVPVDHTPTP